MKLNIVLLPHICHLKPWCIQSCTSYGLYDTVLSCKTSRFVTRRYGRLVCQTKVGDSRQLCHLSYRDWQVAGNVILYIWLCCVHSSYWIIQTLCSVIMLLWCYYNISFIFSNVMDYKVTSALIFFLYVRSVHALNSDCNALVVEYHDLRMQKWAHVT